MDAVTQPGRKEIGFLGQDFRASNVTETTALRRIGASPECVQAED